MAAPATDTKGETAVEYAVLQIKDLIRTGKLAPGQRLVANDLVARLGVSAGPVREAIRKLSGEGLVEVSPHKGAAVLNLGRDDISTLYEVREAIEGQAARLAALKATTAAKKKPIKQAFNALESAYAARNGRDYANANQQFHSAILAAAENERLAKLGESLALPVHLLRYHRLLDDASMASSLAEHRTIYKAIMANDETSAERFLRAHIRSSGSEIVKQL